jgi:hypothetical protein
MRHTTAVLTLALFFSTVVATGTAHALNVETHSLVNAAASGTTAFDLFLRGDLGLLRGLQESFQGKSVFAWIGEGAIREDDMFPTPRFLRHFHDPLKPWDKAGLGEFDSSIRWMQRNDQKWSWQAVRHAYHTALTAANPSPRERAWADMFRGLGQIMHLVVDASVPEHTRNDPHPLESICRTVRLRCYGNYEYWVSDSQAEDVIGFWAAYLSNPADFDTTIFERPTGDTAAPAPIARLIDTDTYTGDDPNVTISQAIGLGEFANANFFSEDTGDRTYPFPSVAMLESSRLPAPKTGHTRAYFKKGLGDGILVDPALAECVLYQSTAAEGVLRPISYTCVDENVWEATARLMLPRAVGYARGVLDYFFRGRIEIAPPDRFVYGLAPFLEGNTGAFTSLRFKVRNATPNEDAGGSQNTPGQMVAVVRYRMGAADPITEPAVRPSDNLFLAVSETRQVSLTGSFQELDFDFKDNPLPTNAVDVFLTVVWRGQLGLEPDAVLVGGKDLFEPDPLDIANVTDFFCDSGQPAYVPRIPPFDLFSPDPQPWRDPNGDGSPDIFGPEVELDGVFTKLLSLSADPFQVDYVNHFDFRLPQRGVAEYARFFALQDQPAYLIARFEPNVVELGTTPNLSSVALFGTVAPGKLNRLRMLPDGRVAHEYSDPIFYRGLISQNLTLLLPGILFVPGQVQAFQACLPATITAKPFLSPIEGALGQP